MIVDPEKLRKSSKARLGVPNRPRGRPLRYYRPSPMQKRARLMGAAVGVLMTLALAIGAAYMVYTLFDTGSNIAERKIAELEAGENPAENPAKPSASQVRIIFEPSAEPEKQ